MTTGLRLAREGPAARLEVVAALRRVHARDYAEPHALLHEEQVAHAKLLEPCT